MKKFILAILVMCVRLFGNAQTENGLEKFNTERVKKLRANCYKVSFKKLENNEAYVFLFSNPEGKKALRGVYDYYTDIKRGLWNVKNQTVKFLRLESNESLAITISSKLERDLTKEERKSIKGKVSKKDYKSSKYHQIGVVKYSLTIQQVENNPRIIKGEEMKKIKYSKITKTKKNMNLHKDYIIAEQANMMDLANFTKQIKCVFIGTNNYFFAIPYNMVDFRPGYTTDTTETTDMYYEGMGLQEFLLEKVKEPGLAVEDFEKFVINENFNGIQLLNINEDFNRFKVQASFWGSGITYNKREGKMGWKPFVMRYKKEKKDVKEFYKNHSKCETK